MSIRELFSRRANPPPAEGLRFERKFLVEGLDAAHLQAAIRLHPAMFDIAYPPRHVNNIYLDDNLLESYYENVSGIGERLKARVRWYGPLFGRIQRPVLELKMKRALAGRKSQFPLPPLALDGRFGWQALRSYFRSAALPQELQLRLGGLQPTLLNRYRRRYYASRDGRFRLTLDSELAYYHVRRAGNHFLHRGVDYQHLVLELKYLPQDDDRARQVASAFPFRISRNSKYVQGIERVFY